MVRHLRSLSLFILLATGTPAVRAGVVFTDGFEGATLDPFWTTSIQSGSIAFDNTLVHSGSQSIRLSSTDTGLDKGIALQHLFAAPVYGQASVWFFDTGADESSSNYIAMALSNTGTGTYSMLVAYDYGFAGGGPGRGDQYNLADSPFSGTTLASGIDRTKDWHQYTINSTPTGLTMSIDGVEVYSRAGDTPFDHIQLSLSGPSWRPSWTTAFDDFEFRQYSVPEPGTLVLSSLALVGLCARGMWIARRRYEGA